MGRVKEKQNGSESRGRTNDFVWKKNFLLRRGKEELRSACSS